MNSEKRRGAAVFLALCLVAAGAAVACSPTDTPEPTYTAVPIAPTAWPSGTTGQYGLHIDPSLLGKLPRSVAAQTLVEDADIEAAAMDNADLAKTFDNYAAASVGQITDTDWFSLVIGHARDQSQASDIYQAWAGQYATGSCSQANGVASSGQEQIGDWLVDKSICGGGPIVYTLSLGNGLILSVLDNGPDQWGRKLIEAIYF
ncbi:MAG TPA: hypothetical protein VF337_12540 [Candidatus Limnocylindrales bacterium]